MQDTFVFVDFSKDEYAQLIRGIYSHRIQILFAGNIPEMFRLIPSARSPFIIVGLPTDYNAESVIADFLKLSRLEEFCFVFVGQNVKSHEGRIAKVLPHSVALNIPTTGDDVLGAIEYLRTFQREVHQPSDFGAMPREGIPTNVGDRSESSLLVRGISKLCFQTLSSPDLNSLTLNCSPIFRAAKLEDLPDDSYYPDNREVRDISEKLTQHAGKRGAVHLHRAAALSSRILAALNIDSEVLESAKNAAFLFAWSFVARPELFSVDYLLAQKAEVRQQCAHYIAHSAEKVARELGLRNEQQIVLTISRLLGEGYRLGDQACDLVSSTIMTSDLVDRVCWQNGYWDPRGVHLLMHRFSAAEVPDIHPRVLALTLKSLCEALEGMGANLLRARAYTKQPSLELQIEATKDTPRLSAKEQPVLLSRLMPGMRVSRPVSTFDGRTVLLRDTLLDEDLIWRLWQIAAVRPLDPVHVVV